MMDVCVYLNGKEECRIERNLGIGSNHILMWLRKVDSDGLDTWNVRMTQARLNVVQRYKRKGLNQLDVRGRHCDMTVLPVGGEVTWASVVVAGDAEFSGDHKGGRPSIKWAGSRQLEANKILAMETLFC